MSDVGAMIQVKLGRPLVTTVLQWLVLVGARINRSIAKVVITTLRHFYLLQRRGGIRFLVIYMKAASVLVQQSVAGQRLTDMSALGCRMSRTKGGGLPTFIPALHRARIRNGDPIMIRLWLTLLGLYRVLEFPGKFKLDSITDKTKMPEWLIPKFSDFIFNHFIPTLKVRYPSSSLIRTLIKHGSLGVLGKLVAVPFLLPKSSPSARGGANKISILSTSAVGILQSAWLWLRSPLYPALEAWCKMTKNIWVLNRMESWTRPWYPLTSLALQPNKPSGLRLHNPEVTRTITLTMEETRSRAWAAYEALCADLHRDGSKIPPFVEPVTPLIEEVVAPDYKVPVGPSPIATSQWAWTPSMAPALIDPKTDHANVGTLGALGTKEEAAGKIRVFALVDCWTQWLMKPLHDGLFGILANIEQDGTFDQTRPIEKLLDRLPKGTPIYCFDLSSATDRIPITLQKVLLTPFLTAWGAELWATLLVGRAYRFYGLPKIDASIQGKVITTYPTDLLYGAGQPMGALSSWAMLALIHHAFVQWAALRCGLVKRPGDWFADYAVLGDDIAIASKPVAEAYQDIMARIDVAIGLHKSLISLPGLAIEFAKKFYLRGQNLSPISFAEFFIGRQDMTACIDLVRKYNLSMGQMLSVLGYGYRSKASATGRLLNLPRRLRHWILMYYGPTSPHFLGWATWYGLRSVGVTFKTLETRVGQFLEMVIEAERKLLLDRLDQLAPLIKEIVGLATVKRDREHYGAAPMDPSRRPFQEGLDATERGEEMPAFLHVLDSINETVYREAFLDVASDVRSLRTSLEELAITETDWSAVATLWSQLETIEEAIGALPLPKSLYSRTNVKVRSTTAAAIKRWNAYSKVFRATA